ncbi:uncharacterized protein EAF01_011937 [Botrytis porri]|nr:uncharacterized protein EAF01_011937 [Botrytis porri]KAF7880772.1 hypothetical protein EAF01_011937 [Botrytis porri]
MLISSPISLAHLSAQLFDLMLFPLKRGILSFEDKALKHSPSRFPTRPPAVNPIAVQLNHPAIFRVLAAAILAVPTALSLPGLFDKSQQLTSKFTCDQLSKNSCLYTFYANQKSAITTMVDSNCTDYGQDHVIFNRTEGVFGMDGGPKALKDHVWVLSNFTRLNAPEAVVGFTSPLLPELQWLDKSYSVLRLLNANIVKPPIVSLGLDPRA